MNNEVKSCRISEIHEKVKLISQNIAQEEGVDCSLILEGNEVVLSGNRAALLSLAWRVLELADVQVPGKHFTIDIADIAPDANCSLTIAFRPDPPRAEV